VPAKYVIHTKPVKPRFRPVGKLGIIDWREDCSSCHNCVKRECVYDLYRNESQELHTHSGYLDYIYQCNGCLVCVQECTKNILTRVVNPEYDLVGDEHYTPDIILSTWYQSETGGIPVSGSGYGGKFTGSGFNSMWTDMSEIVRPTRDGIHGREYINTGVTIGKRLNHLSFTDGRLDAGAPPRLEMPMPLLFDVIPENFCRGQVLNSICGAAAALGMYTIVEEDKIVKEHAGGNNIIPLLDKQGKSAGALPKAPLVMIRYSADTAAQIAELKKAKSDRIVGIRIDATGKSEDEVEDLALKGAEVVNIVFDKNGYEKAKDKPRHMRDVLRGVHKRLVKDGIRDEITIIASGGIALPEYMAKAIICGADIVTIDLALVIGLECRLCLACTKGERCPVSLEHIEKEYAQRRITNLIAAWRNQLLEMLGAMGIREVKRLRGEVGRCMFFEDLERETFAPLFGTRKV
jgi:ferredoxin